MTGLVGFASGYAAMKNCDALLMLGTDFPYRAFYPEQAKIIQVDVRPEALGNRCSLHLGLLGNVKDTRCVGHNLFLGDVRISSTYNKFRLFGLQHHWSEQAYLDNRRFLEAIRRNDILAVNNFAAMTISEDKAIFAAMPMESSRAMTSRTRALLP